MIIRRITLFKVSKWQHCNTWSIVEDYRVRLCCPKCHPLLLQSCFYFSDDDLVVWLGYSFAHRLHNNRCYVQAVCNITIFFVGLCTSTYWQFRASRVCTLLRRIISSRLRIKSTRTRSEPFELWSFSFLRTSVRRGLNYTPVQEQTDANLHLPLQKIPLKVVFVGLLLPID